MPSIFECDLYTWFPLPPLKKRNHGFLIIIQTRRYSQFPRYSQALKSRSGWLIISKEKASSSSFIAEASVFPAFRSGNRRGINETTSSSSNCGRNVENARALPVTRFVNRSAYDVWCTIVTRILAASRWHDPAPSLGIESVTSRKSYARSYEGAAHDGLISTDALKCGIEFFVLRDRWGRRCSQWEKEERTGERGGMTRNW